MMDPKAAESFWHAVKACLEEFHNFTEVEAERRGAALREQIESPPTGMSSNMFYHAEPFDVACDIAARKVNLADNRQRYDEILVKHGW